jgi:hypothetical protein
MYIDLGRLLTLVSHEESHQLKFRVSYLRSQWIVRYVTIQYSVEAQLPVGSGELDFRLRMQQPMMEAEIEQSLVLSLKIISSTLYIIITYCKYH